MPSAAAADAAHGQELYESRCGGCHSLDANRVGPAHRGVYGRKARLGAELQLLERGQELDRGVGGRRSMPGSPIRRALIPGQRMNFRVALPQDRADIIAYLRQQSGK